MNKPRIKSLSKIEISIIQDKLEKYLASNKLNSVFEELDSIKEELCKELAENIILLHARYKDLERRIIEGTISTEEATRIRNQIRSSLLKLIKELDKECKGFRKAPLKKVSFFLIITALIVALLFYIIPPTPSSFDLTIFVHGPAGKLDYVLENKGEIVFDLNGDRRVRKIGQYGRTNFDQIPGTFHGKEIPITVEALGFESVYPDSSYLLNGEAIYFAVKKNVDFRKISGEVKDKNSKAPIAKVKVKINDFEVIVTDKQGEFDFLVPENKEAESYQLTFSKEGYSEFIVDYAPIEDASKIFELKIKKRVVGPQPTPIPPSLPPQSFIFHIKICQPNLDGQYLSLISENGLILGRERISGEGSNYNIEFEIRQEHRENDIPFDVLINGERINTASIRFADGSRRNFNCN